jgi:Ca-activated chloride channel homolog
MKNQVLIFIFFIVCENGFSQTAKHDRPRVLFILDASYSMNRKWENELMWNVAIKTLSDFATLLDQKYGAELAVRVYGHNFDIAMNNCKDTKLEIPMGFGNSTAIKEKLKLIRYQGTTPIAYSMTFASEDFKNTKGKNNIILITDGEETCGGDPCKVSNALQSQGITLKPIVIGMNISEFGVQNLKCIGDLSNAISPKDMKPFLEKSLEKILDKTTFEIDLMDSKNNPSESDVAMTFISLSGKKTNWIHTLTNAKPDSLYMEDLVEFTAKIHTIPVIEKKVTLEKFKHNVIKIDAAQGYLDIKQVIKGGVKPTEVLIRKENKTIHVAELNSKTKLLKGNYSLEILTLPILKKSIAIEGEKTNEIIIPEAGTLILQKSSSMTGGVFIKEKNILKKIYDILPNTVTENVIILPGKYLLIYKSSNQTSIYNTIEKSFEILSGSKVLLNL